MQTDCCKLKDNNFLLQDFSWFSLDVALALILFFLTLPLQIIGIFLVWLDRTGPIFYMQERYGKDKCVFKIYKFRTMHTCAENGRPIWGKEFDLRSSKIGNFLRITHIDEFPQLLNVLKGEMSLVGPRPERPFFADKFKLLVPDYEQRHKLKPGITGWAQINGLRGGGSCINERTLYDIYYVKNRSPLFYLKIIFLTPFAKPEKHGQMDQEYRKNLNFKEASRKRFSLSSLCLPGIIFSKRKQSF